MTYGRIETVADLPPAGPLNERAREKSDLDFKTFADPAKMWEHAKDIAAFSNALGGVLLIGAEDETGQLVYQGIAGQTVKDLETIYYDAARFCSPAPVVNVVGIPERNLVAVNVDPFLDQLVAAPAGTRDKNGKELKHNAAWVFPIRRGALIEWIEPENLAMYMNREVRRALLLLSQIPESSRREVRVHFHVWANSATEAVRLQELELALDEFSFERNYVVLVKDHGSSAAKCRVPLLDIEDVWESKPSKWSLRISGRLGDAPDDRSRPISLAYSPMPRRH